MNAKTDDAPAMSKAKELADKLNSLCVAEFAWPYLNDAATELRRLAALEQTPRKPMTDAQRRRVIDEAGFNTEGLTQDDFAQEIISGAERFHDIKE